MHAHFAFTDYVMYMITAFICQPHGFEFEDIVLWFDSAANAQHAYIIQEVILGKQDSMMYAREKHEGRSALKMMYLLHRLVDSTTPRI